MKKLINQPNVSPATAAFPFGDVNDNTGSNNGTPMNRESMSDIFQFFAKLAAESGIVQNDLLDNETDGFQLYEAFRKLTKPYKVYTALLTQVGTAAPTAVILGNNEIGTIVWSRISAGVYTGTLVGAFGPRTFVIMGSIPGGGAIEYVRGYSDGTNDNVYLVTLNSGGTNTDGILDKIEMEIRVYDF